MSQSNQNLFIGFLVVNLSAVWAFGFANESISYLNSANKWAYQLITTHFSHHSQAHLAGNIIGMWLLLFLFPGKNHIYLTSFVVCIIMTAFYVYTTSITAFLGASALLYCIPGNAFVIAMKANFWKANTILTSCMVYLLYISPIKSQLIGGNWTEMTSSHLIGLFSGAVVQMLFLINQELTKKDT